MNIPWLDHHDAFPDVEQALTETDGAAGLLAAGADLSPQRLLEAYRQGIFPWFSEGQPILWWSTDPRMVLQTAHFVVSDSLKKTLRKVSRDSRWEVRFDCAFEQVMRACAAPRRDGPGTWISEEIVAGYCGLHRLGYAHSSEVWLDGELVGGAYGVSIGRMFYGESMFARVTDASKIALAYLVGFLKSHAVSMIDCQQETAHLASLGAAPIRRAAFIEHLRDAVTQPQIEHWAPVNVSSVVTRTGPNDDDAS
ncbi:leucyl/phenylalanyl-tRNA--protein transferase [Actimicrobium sp. CCI2.3]|uniref:leucyl/phenylalanyl-tRNA--protein transferase n=1 Tax=Actimicrobium sp. CCI2.3 TaxID=3048616 RepID=UPI002AB51924|nr:leucyl/phenylalanyl-tRNA--protein transferase [Actimicrobium sp. CCI2.3]MDY7575628.1 leucyl/phenylalanyl-tRNA--protein transferase [Actimicrobium sp. CCI2.3]MEB0022001.1 leucyl/phenylalanyl-tRNA--protein transferase [Actimicrobium sp. CCI2.3]